MTRPHFTGDFKIDAIKQITERGYSVAEEAAGRCHNNCISDPGAGAALACVQYARSDRAKDHQQRHKNPFIWAALALCMGLLALAFYAPTLAITTMLKPLNGFQLLLAASASLLPLFLGRYGYY